MIGTAGEICILVKFSSKRERLLEAIKVTSILKMMISKISATLVKLCPTHCTVRATCYSKLIMSYHTVYELWSLCLRENLLYDIKSRIGCQAQMEKFVFLFSFNLGYRLYSITDILSNALQQQQKKNKKIKK